MAHGGAWTSCLQPPHHQQDKGASVSEHGPRLLCEALDGPSQCGKLRAGSPGTDRIPLCFSVPHFSDTRVPTGSAPRDKCSGFLSDPGRHQQTSHTNIKVTVAFGLLNLS